jgi:hypothetical protein
MYLAAHGNCIDFLVENKIGRMEIVSGLLFGVHEISKFEM